MHALTVNRRQLLRGLGASAASLLTGHAFGANSLLTLLEAGEEAPLFASARREANGSYALVVFTDSGEELLKFPLPNRGHAVTWHRGLGRMIAFARRPDTFALMADLHQTREPQLFHAPQGRHFYGHGVFSHSGQLVFAPENDYEQARGMIGIYDVSDVSGASIRRLGEFESFGVGPHDILMLQDGRTLVVANGGIETHPAKGREKLNIGHMKPNIALIDSESGALIARYELESELHKLSLRHMGLDGNGDVWVGGQFQGPTADLPPLVAHLGRDSGLTLLEMPEDVATGLQNYVGSVVSNRSGDVIATSCPRGGKVLFWDVASKSYLGHNDVVDGCGLAPIDADSFLISDGTGALRISEGAQSYAEVLAIATGNSWDNHMQAL
ncbi:DUF1513 domain-containing protein [Polycladidibacter hongkongensis]|uniref:DUF1513 domain-containing protein n=1 Tax=Polycladidibacter hongkongensis TaxID=1647556 RepID=UPI000829E1CA|nr:DUF1513 domain-containing protein [Pseudovibrio hongkongensis]